MRKIATIGTQDGWEPHTKTTLALLQYAQDNYNFKYLVKLDDLNMLELPSLALALTH